jgi:transposase-like protein
MPQFKSLFEFLKANPTEQDCIDFYEKFRWKEKLISPFDSTSKVYKSKKRKNWYKCKNTNKYFTVRTETVFRNSNISLQKWFLALYLFFSHKKGISSYQLAKHISITQKTAWFMLHRLRHISDVSIFKEMLKGIVEIDETFIGGKNKNRHWDKKVPHCQGRNWKDKIPFVGMKQRGDNVIVKKVSNTKMKTLLPIIKANIKEGSTIYSDDWYRHSKLSQSFNHQWVNHSVKQYAKGDVSVNSIESFWTFPKRGIYGTYHWISRKHAQKYMDEFALRFNTRKYKEQDRFELVLLSSVGKSLSYWELIASP